MRGEDCGLGSPWAAGAFLHVSQGVDRHPRFQPCIADRLKTTKSTWLIILLLLLSGDVETNPGPVRFPCGICERAVKVNQRGIQCDGCDVWLHTKCIGMSSKIYQCLAESSATWICSNCGMPNLSLALFQTPAHPYY